MKLYLSSYELGDDPAGLVALYGANKRVGYVPNARDFTTADPERKVARTENDMAGLASLGLMPELLDLSEYFGRKQALAERFAELGGLWISGGNVFVLRQAMRLSGFDDILPRLLAREDFVYGGYSAAGCVLSPTLRAYSIVDPSEDFPYPDIRETIWEGLGVIAYAFMPHYKSDHPESADVDREIEHCIAEKIPFIAVRDGEALVFEIPAEVFEIPSLLPCFCCDERTVWERGCFEICPTCGWEDDPIQWKYPDQAGGANSPSLSEAREIWRTTRKHIK